MKKLMFFSNILGIALVVIACGANTDSAPVESLHPTVAITIVPTTTVMIEPSQLSNETPPAPASLSQSPESQQALTLTQPSGSHAPLIGMGVAGNYLWLIMPQYVVQIDIQTNEAVTFSQYELPAPLFPTYPWRMPVVMDRSGGIWFGGSEGASYYNGKTWKVYTTFDGLVGNVITDIEIDKTGLVWISTDSGISSFNGSIWKSYTTANGLVDNTVWDILIPKSGSVWFATRNGVSQFNGVNWKNWTIENTTGVLSGQIFGLTLDTQGNVLVVTDTVIVRHNGISWEHAYEKWAVWCHLDYAYNYVTAFDRNGTLWSGTSNAGVKIFDGSQVTSITKGKGLVGESVIKIQFDDFGSVWIATSRGVSKFDGKTWLQYTIAQDTLALLVETPQNLELPVSVPVEKTGNNCPDAWSKLKSGMMAIITASWVPIYSQPINSINQYGIGELQPGMIVKILEGPVIDQAVWWKIESQDIPGGEGWVQEGYLAYPEHALEPFEPTSRPCGTGWSRLSIGKQAILLPGDPNLVRREPQKGDNVIGKLYPGEIVKIIEGPICADGLVFWKAESSTIPGGSGWTAEGDGKEYWLEPLN